MKCPTCHNMMIVVEHEHVELDYCPDCEGVWFDAGELDLLLETMQLQKSVLSIDSVLTSQETKSSEKKRKCPICNKKMKKSTVGHDPEVLIDACSSGDGLWFDAGEVGQIITQVPSTQDVDSQGRVIRFLGDVFKARD